MLAGDTVQVAKILQQLRASEEPESLVLWMIAKDMRNILNLQSGASYQSLGIWQISNSCIVKRCIVIPMTLPETGRMHCTKPTKPSKGLVQPVWELLYQLAFRPWVNRYFTSCFKSYFKVAF